MGYIRPEDRNLPPKDLIAKLKQSFKQFSNFRLCPIIVNGVPQPTNYIEIHVRDWTKPIEKAIRKLSKYSAFRVADTYDRIAYLAKNKPENEQF